MAVVTAEEAMATTAEHAPITARRKPATHDIKLPKPCLPRALVAADEDHPHGSPGRYHHNYSVLQQHVEFFDRNKDGIVHPWETFAGFRAVGFGWTVSFWAMVFINGSMSYNTQESWIPSPLFSIYIKNIHRAKHGSDAEVYDREGRFIPYKFEELFSKYAKSHQNRLTFREMWEMTEHNRDAYDFYGWTAAKLEWGVTYWLAKDEKGLLPKEAMRAVYDGSLFYYLEKLQHAKKAAKFI